MRHNEVSVNTTLTFGSMKTVWYSSRMRYLKTNRMGCFSPPVMIATFAIEIGLAIYVNWRYKFNDVTRLAIAILFFLAVFQLAEFNVCEGAFGIDGLSWSRLGYVAITMLPPLGFHLATRLAGDKRNNGSVALAYISAGAFATFFAFSGHGITSQACLGNYVIFSTAPGSAIFYSFYYYGWLIAGTMYSLHKAGKMKQQNRANALRALTVGYLAFIVPTTTVNIVDPSTISGIPSIMCGFAVLLAIAIAGEVLPQYYRATSLSEMARGEGMVGDARGKVSK